MKLTFPKHKASMHITHNDHKSSYETAEDWILCNDDNHYADWISAEEKAKALETDSIWTLQWYPETPIGFCCVAASSFEALMEHFEREAGRATLNHQPDSRTEQ